MKKEMNHGIIHLSKSKLALTRKVLKLKMEVGEGEGKQSPFKESQFFLRPSL